MTDKRLVSDTRGTYFNVIRSFYKRNYQELTFFRGDFSQAEALMEGSAATIRQEIKKRMIEVSRLRDRVLIF